jgi:hypothetical protein
MVVLFMAGTSLYQIAHIREMRKSYRLLVGNPKGKTQEWMGG